MPTAVTVGIASGIIAYQLLIPPVVGLANNADFESVMGYVGFQYLTADRAEKYFSWIITKFAFGPPGWFQSGLMTSETLLAWLARLMSEPFSGGGSFDLRVLGGIHSILFIAGLGLLVSATRPLAEPARWAGAALLLFFFTDVGYVAPLNSFYSQAASIVFLFLTLGVAARSIALGTRDPRHAALFFALAALFASSKPQEAIQALLLAAFGLRLYWQPGPGIFGQPAAWAALGLVAFSGLYLSTTPPAISEVARYHKVFMELLPNSPAPARDLEDLGLDPAWANAAGKIAYKPGPFSDPAFRAAFLARFSYAKLVLFYLTHPDRLASTLSRGGQQALLLRHPRFGNLEHRPGVEPGAKASSFSAWSSARARMPGQPLSWLAPFFVLNLLLAAATRRGASPDGKLARDGIILLVTMATVAFMVCVLSNAHGDLPRHLYIFQALCDLLLVADLVWGIAALAPRAAAPGLPS